MDVIDRALLAILQRDATQPYAALGQAVGLSAAAAHERVRRLRERGIIRGTVADVDPAALGRTVLSFVLVSAGKWAGGQRTRDALAALPDVEEAHIIAGQADVLLKVRTSGTAGLQQALRGVHAIDGVTSTEAIVVLETFFERATDPADPAAGADPAGSADPADPAGSADPAGAAAAAPPRRRRAGQP